MAVARVLEHEPVLHVCRECRFGYQHPFVSVVDLTCRLSTPAKKENIHRAIKTAAAGAMERILFHTTGEEVQTDFPTSACSSVHDKLRASE